MPDSTDADLDSILAFGTAVGELAQGSATSLATDMETISQARIGMSGTDEGMQTMERYAGLAQGGYQFVSQVGVGLMAMGLGAQTIAVNYANSDASQQDDMTVVFDAFHPPAGEGLQDQFAAQAAEQAAASGTPEGPSVQVDGQAVTLPPATTEGPAEPAQGADGQFLVDHNRELYGEYENQYDNQQVEGGLQIQGPPAPPQVDAADLENYD